MIFSTNGFKIAAICSKKRIFMGNKTNLFMKREQKNLGQKPKTTETIPHFEAENLKALFSTPEMDLGLKLFAPYGLQRIQRGDQRFYSRVTEDMVRRYYLSVTSYCGRTKDSFGVKLLQEWKTKLGEHIAREYARVAAEYGTFFHIEAAEMLRNGGYDFGHDGQRLDNLVCEWALEHRIPSYVWQDIVAQAHNDLIAFAHFIIDYEVEPLAVEIAVCDDEYGLGGAIDGIFRMKHGNRKEKIIACFDIKTSKSLHKEYQKQLAIYQKIANRIFGDILEETYGSRITHCYNWRSKQWTKDSIKDDKKPYILTNQTDKIDDAILEHELKEVVMKGWNKPFSGMKRAVGKLDLTKIVDTPKLMEQNVEYIHLDEYLNDLLDKRQNQNKKRNANK